MNYFTSSASGTEPQHCRSLAWKTGCVALATLLVVGLFPISATHASAFGESRQGDETLAVSDRMLDEGEQLIVVYKDEAPDIYEPLEIDKAQLADSSDGVTLADLGVVEQSEVAPAGEGSGEVSSVQLAEGADVESVSVQLEAAEEVAYVQPDYAYELMEVNDPYAQHIEGDSDYQYYLDATRTVEGWDLAKTEDAVSIAVLDTGIAMGHPDLEGRIDSAHAYDVTTGEPLVGNSDVLDHGTMVAGVLAAQANNGQGIAGASFNASILPIKVFDAAGKCSTSSLIAAYAYLDDLMSRGELPCLKVINLSLGYYASDDTEADRVLEDAIASMRDKHGVLTICAGGNGDASQSGRCYPADFAEAVAVTGLTQAGSEALWSAVNGDKDISAPAEGILSTSADGGYRSATGTSMAAPQVSAAAALLWAADASLTADEVEGLLEKTAAPVSDMRAENGSAGALDVRASLEQVLGVESVESEDEENSQDAEADSLPSEDPDAIEHSEADDAAPEEDRTEIDDPASSWRYRDGEKLQVAPEATTEDVPAGEIRPLGAAEGVASYATWEKSNGATSYTWKAKPTDAGTRIAIPGAKRVGIDVSAWQGTVDWKKVKASGISFAIIRCGTYNKALKAHTIDPQFIANVKGARANGIDVGAYIYSYATNVTGAQSSEAEAKNVLSFLKQAGLTSANMALPIYYDLEDNSQVGFGSAKLGQMAKKFCDTVAAQGYSVGIYANQNWWRNYLTDSVFKSTNWSRWAARYPGGNKANDSGVERTDIWQFSDCGKVDGIGGYVDMNIDYGGAAAYRKKTVSDGEYMISSALDGKMVVDVPGSSVSNGRQLNIFAANGQLNQRFSLSYDAKTGFYSIVNSYSGKALAVSGSTAKSGLAIVQAEPKNALEQRWIIRQVKSGVYSIHSAIDPDYVIDVKGGGAKNGTVLQLYPSNGTAAQQFRFTRSMPIGATCAKTLANGTYTISTSLKANMVLDISGGSKANSANVQIYRANKTAAQRYRVIYDPKTGYYTLLNDNSGKALDVTAGTAKNGANVQQYVSNNTLAQKWIISKESNGSYRIASALNISYVLDVAGGKTSNCTNVQLYTANRTASQMFKFDKVAVPARAIEPGTYTIGTALAAGKTLDIKGGSKKNSGNLQLYSLNGTPAQRFKVTFEESTGYYIITNVNSGKVLDVKGGRAANKTNVQQYTSNGTKAQRWVITKQGSGYRIASALNTNYVLDIAGGRKSNGANIQLYKANGTNAQCFTFRKL